LQEKSAEAKEIARDALELRGLFQEVNVLVADQHEQLQTVENNVNDASDRVKAGNKGVMKVQ
jgi:t-SNARE complex subunit (syntaxin)